MVPMASIIPVNMWPPVEGG